MKLSELINAVGDEHIQLQNLASSTLSAKVDKRGGVIEFCTDETKVTQLMNSVMTGEHPDYTGFVVWIPRERIPNP